MAPIGALLDGRAALAVVKRTVPRAQGPVIACRRAPALTALVASRPLDGIVLGTGAARRLDLARLREQFPMIPLFIFGTVRSEEAGLMLAFYERFGVAALLVEGVDDAIVGDVIGRATVTARRRAQLTGVPRQLRLTEPLQLAAFEALLSAGPRPSTALLAARLDVSREHLSRQFGAGGAPNLKRVVDLFRVLATRDLLQNPGYPPAVAARLLGYSTPSHLRAVTRRVVGVAVKDLPRLPNAELLRRFLAVGARSRRD
jgi:AraC-like DNA-binding protein